MASYVINNTGFRYQSEKIVVQLDTPFTGNINDKISIKNVISQRTAYTFADCALRGSEDPFFDANQKQKNSDLDASIG